MPASAPVDHAQHVVDDGAEHVTILATDEDVRAAEREQWDDGTNYLAVSPGVVFGYDRNVATNAMLESHGFEVVKVSGG